MKNQRFLFLFLLFFNCLIINSLAQTKASFPDTPAEFILAVNDMLKKTQKPEAIKVAEIFSGVWDNGKISSTQKEKIISVSKKMLTARATAAGGFTQFYSGICNALNERKLNTSIIDDYLNVLDKLSDAKNLKDINSYVERFDKFFLSQALFYSRTNRAYATGDFKIDYLAQKDEKLQAEFASAPSQDSTFINAPDIVGPIIRFNQTNLIFAYPLDSVALQNTKGIFIINKNVFVGKGGKFDWRSLELNPNEVFCEFDSYATDLSKGNLNAKNVKMTYTPLFNKQILGDFEFSSRARKDIYNALFPKFISAENNIRISQFGQNLEYQGGFTLEGRKIYSNSRNAGQLAAFWGKSKDDDGNEQTSFKVTSRRFAITDSLITSPNVRFSLYLGEKDSLSHASLQFRYTRGSKKTGGEVQLVRDRNSMSSNTPFINNHHEFYIDADLIRYDIAKDSMDMYMLSGAQDLRPAVFESFDFFSKDRYNKMMAVYDFNPIKMFLNFAREPEIKSNTFFISQLASKYRKNEGILRSVAVDLQSRGYLNFDESNGFVTLGSRINKTDSTDLFISATEKVRSKGSKRQDSLFYAIYDHDNYRITSVVSGEPNASLSRKKNELVIRGIKSFPISELLNVYIIPDSSKRKITVYGGRNLYMEKGEITVGNFRFVGQNFFLLYKDFTLEMPVIDKVLFAVTDTTSEKKESYYYGGEIAFKPGRMEINDPLNKSGRKKGRIIAPKDEVTKDKYVLKKESYEAFPKLSIPEGGTMYFATEFRQNFAYDSTRAKFEIFPIEMDSLNTKVPIFPGKFTSNIFPEFKETLVPMQAPDNTMGFTHKPPKTGYPLYPTNEKLKGAKILFNKDLVMNRDGLFSGGTITHLTTTLVSPEFFMMPDSVLADNTDFSVKSGNLKGAEFADATGKTAQLHWNTTDDRMVISNKDEIERLENARTTLAKGAFEQRYKEKLFTLYSSTKNPMSLRGYLNITSEGLKGEGNLVRKDFTLLSVSEEPFKFGIDKFSASNVEFRINSKARDPYEFDRGFFYANNKAVLLGNFVDVDFDLKSGKAELHPDSEFLDFASLSLPYAEYRTSIRDALWDLNKQTIAMNGDSTSYFVSTIFGSEDYNEENLRFRANKGFYDIPNLSLLVSGIPFINSADASIVPIDGKATILKDAEMQELKKAIVLIDTLNRYHRLFNGNIKIDSRLTFEGDATYQFVNVKKDTFNIKFDKFELITADTDPGKAEANERDNKRKKGKYVPRYTFAQGTVEEKDKFYITSRVLYKGAVKMYANRRNLSLDGFIKLDLSSREGDADWIPYKSDKGDSVSLNLAEKTKIGEEEVTSGMHFSPALDLYTTFISRKQSDQDTDIFLAKGNLDYSPSINEFKIALPEKKEGKIFGGNQLIYDDSKGEVYIQGKLNLWDAALAKQVLTVGSSRSNTKKKSHTFDLMLPFDLPLGVKSIMEMQRMILGKLPEKSPTIGRNDPLNDKFAEILGDKEYRKFIQEGAVRPSLLVNTSKELKKPLVFTTVNMEWNDEYKTFYSKDSLRLFNVNEKVVDSYVTGYIEFRKNTGGDGYSIYLQIDPDLWYYFEVDAGVFSALSSDEPFNQGIDNKAVQLAGIDKKEAFVAKFRELYKAAALPENQKKEEVKKEPEKKDPKKEKKSDDDDGF